jgi:multidrug resistance efflux pump
VEGDEALWAEFTQAAGSDVYCRAWLALQCRAIPAVSAGLIVLGPPDRGPFSPAAVWPDSRRNVAYLGAAAERALVERRGLLLKSDAESSGGRERFDVAYPIEVGGRLHGAVVLDVAPRPEPQLQAVLRQLQWGFAWLEVLVRRQDAARDGDVRARLEAVVELLGAAVGKTGALQVAIAFVTAVATRFGCDRVSVGFVRRGHVQVWALSHSATFKRRTNLVRAIGDAMDEAVDQAVPVVVPPPPGGPPTVTRAHETLAALGGGTACSIPLRAGGSVVGALTLERGREQAFDQSTVELCEALAALAGPILDLHRREDRQLATKALEAGRERLHQLVGVGHSAAKLAVAAALILIVLLATVHGDYRVAAPTVLEAQVMRAAVAPFTGYIAEASVRAGDRVRAGDLLGALDDRDLRLERLRWASQYEQFDRQHQEALAKRNAAQVNIIAAQLDQARAQLALLDDQISRIRIRAPFDGLVVKGDLSQSLGAPVERGQVLFEVAPLDAYRVVLEVDERDIAAVAPGQRGLLFLSADPRRGLDFVVERVTPLSAAREGRNAFRVEARLETGAERLRPGLQGVGKITIDRRRVVWIWTHQAIDWVRFALWRWLP